METYEIETPSETMDAATFLGLLERLNKVAKMLNKDLPMDINTSYQESDFPRRKGNLGLYRLTRDEIKEAIRLYVTTKYDEMKSYLLNKGINVEGYTKRSDLFSILRPHIKTFKITPEELGLKSFRRRDNKNHGTNQ